jgi:hypothetical protein
MPPDDGTSKQIWTMANSIMAAMGAMVILLLTLGYYGLMNKIDTGDALTRAQLVEVVSELKAQNTAFQALCQTVARIDTLQKIRIDKEVREERQRRYR